MRMYYSACFDFGAMCARIEEWTCTTRRKTYQVVQNLVPYDAHHLEALLAADRVDDHVAMNADEVLGVKNAVLVLAGGVDHLDGKVMVAVADDFAESVFDGRVVRVDKVPVDVLHCEGGLACARDVLLAGGPFLRTLDENGREEAYRQIYCRRWPSCAASAEEACCWWTASLAAWCNSIGKGDYGLRFVML